MLHGEIANWNGNYWESEYVVLITQGTQSNETLLTRTAMDKTMHKTLDCNSKSIFVSLLATLGALLIYFVCLPLYFVRCFPCINKRHEFVKSAKEQNKKHCLKEICNKSNSFCSATRVAVDSIGIVSIIGGISWLVFVFTVAVLHFPGTHWNQSNVKIARILFGILCTVWNWCRHTFNRVQLPPQLQPYVQMYFILFIAYSNAER